MHKAAGSITKRACDQCKLRKIKCSLSQPCKACASMGFDCTFFQPQKKRGPAGHRVSQIRQQQQQQQQQQQNQNQSQQLKTTSPEQRPPSIPDTFAYQTPPPPESTHAESIAAVRGPEADWTQAAHVAIPQNGGVVLPSAAPASWNADAVSLNSHGSSSISWSERNDMEYWAPDNLNAQIPIFDFPGSNIYLRPSLPSIIQPEADPVQLESHSHHHRSHSLNPQQQSPIESAGLPVSSAMQSLPSELDALDMSWPPSINEANMIPWIDVYFDRLHPTLPVVNRSSLYIRMLAQEHRRNPHFGSMLLSLCAFALTQPIEIDERPTSSSRASQARIMMYEAIKMRSCSDFGEHPTIEAILTSFFLFGCLFGSYQHNAAWLRLREALDLAATLGLNDPDSYHTLPSEEKGQRLRTYLVLSITERAYALQRRHPITFWGRPGFSMRPIHDFIHSATHSLVSGVIVHNEKDAEGMMGLARLMELFDAIDEDVVDCWNGQCGAQGSYCQRLTDAKALTIHDNLNRINESERSRGYDWFEQNRSALGGADHGIPTTGAGMFLKESQCADVFLTQRWLQNRLWLLCSSHGLLRAQSSRPELTFHYAIIIAESALNICKSLRLSSMEAHGIGLAEKLYDIAVCAINVQYNMNAPLKSPYNLTASTEGISAVGIPHHSMASDQASPVSAVTSVAAAISAPTSASSSAPAAVPASVPSIAAAASAPARLGLAEDYLLLLSSFRGGNHPYLEKFKSHLSSLRNFDSEPSPWMPAPS